MAHSEHRGGALSMSGPGAGDGGVLHADVPLSPAEARARLRELHAGLSEDEVLPEFFRQHLAPTATMSEELYEQVAELYAQIADADAGACKDPGADLDMRSECGSDAGGGGDDPACASAGEVPPTVPELEKACGFTLDECGGEKLDAPVSLAEALHTQRLNEENVRDAFVDVASVAQLGRVYDNMDQQVQRLTFVMAADMSKSSTPQMLHKVLFVLKLLERRYVAAPRGKQRHAGPDLNNIHRTTLEHLRVRKVLGHTYHMLLSDDEEFTVPVMDVRMRVEPLTTGGAKPLVNFYIFVEVVFPLTLNVLKAINDSCSAEGAGAAGAEELQRLWVDIACHQATLGGARNQTRELNIRFPDLFDQSGPFWLPLLTTAAHCVASARRHMHMYAHEELVRATGVERAQLPQLNVQFPRMDRVIAGKLFAPHYDAVWEQLAARAVHANYRKLEEYEAQVLEHHSRKERDKDSSFDDGAGPAEPPQLDWTPVPDVPTAIDWDEPAVADALAAFALTPEHNTLGELLELAEAHREQLRFRGLPPGGFNVLVNMPLVQCTSRGAAPPPFRDFVAENNSFALPESTSLAMLLLKEQPLALLQEPARGDADDANWVTSLLTSYDLRQRLIEGRRTDSDVLLNNRCAGVWSTQLRMAHERPHAHDRVAGHREYLRTTAVQLGRTIMETDDGRRGGANERVAAMLKGADRRAPRSAFRCSAAERFHKWLDYGRAKAARPEHALDSDAGTLYNSLKHMNMLFEVLQLGTGELKRENLSLVLDVLISDVASTLSFWQHAIKGAPNGIGLITWIMNFAGNIFYKTDGHGSVDKQYGQKYNAGYGGGKDFATSIVEKYQNPNFYKSPSDPLLPWLGVADMRNFSEQAIMYMTAQMRDAKGNIISEPTKIPWPMLATELTDVGGEASNKVDAFQKLSESQFRQTSQSHGASRLTVEKNEKSGRLESKYMTVGVFLRVLAASINVQPKSQHAVQLFQVAHTVAMGADEHDNQGELPSKRKWLNLDIGTRPKFTNAPMPENMREAPAPIVSCVMTVSLAVAHLQFGGLYGVIYSGVEGAVAQIAFAKVSAVGNAGFYKRNVDISLENRRKDCALTRMHAFGCMLNSSHALADARSKTESLQDILVRAAQGWIFDPFPLALVPMGMCLFMEQTFDWGIWLVLALLADYFDVPVLALDDVQALFDDTQARYMLPARPRERARRWLAQAGYTDDDNEREDRRCDVIFAEESRADPVLQSGAYLTTRCAPDDPIDGTGLAFLVRAGGPEAAREGAPSRSSAREIVAGHVADNLGLRYGRILGSKFNIRNPRDLKLMIEGLLERSLPFPAFGRMPSGAGFQSVNHLLRAAGCSVTDAAGGGCDGGNAHLYLDGAEREVQAHLQKHGTKYAVPPLLCEAQGGNRYQLGADLRWLLYVRALVGRELCQTSIRRVFAHFTAAYTTFCLPPAVYPYDTAITGVPDVEHPRFLVEPLPRHAAHERPSTLLRTLPDDCVCAHNSFSLQGVVRLNGRALAVEDAAPVNALLHAADTLRKPSENFDIYAAALDVPVPPLAAQAWVPLRMLTRGRENGAVHWGAVRPGPRGVAHRLRVAHARRSDAEPFCAVDCVHKSERALRAARSPLTVRETSGDNIAELCAADSALRPGWCMDFRRAGILLRLPVVGGLDVFATLVPWSSGEWFCPDALGHLAHVPARATTGASGVVELLDDLDAARAGVHVENAREALCEAARQHNAAHDEQVLPAHVVAAVAAGHERFYFVSNRQVQRHIVPLGEDVWLDPTDPLLPDLLREHLLVHESQHAAVPYAEFMSGESHGALVPLLEAMLLYDLPEAAYLGEHKIEHGVTVGVRQLYPDGKVHSALYLSVPARALHARPVLEALDLRPVSCAVVCAHTIA